MSVAPTVPDLAKALFELGKKVEALEKSISESKQIAPPACIFAPEDISLIATQFGGVLKSLAEAVSRLAEKGIGYESRFSSKEGSLTVQLFKLEEAQKEV